MVRPEQRSEPRFTGEHQMVGYHQQCAVLYDVGDDCDAHQRRTRFFGAPVQVVVINSSS